MIHPVLFFSHRFCSIVTLSCLQQIFWASPSAFCLLKRQVHLLLLFVLSDYCDLLALSLKSKVIGCICDLPIQKLLLLFCWFSSPSVFSHFRFCKIICIITIGAMVNNQFRLAASVQTSVKRNFLNISGGVMIY